MWIIMIKSRVTCDKKFHSLIRFLRFFPNGWEFHTHIYYLAMPMPRFIPLSLNWRSRAMYIFMCVANQATFTCTRFVCIAVGRRYDVGSGCDVTWRQVLDVSRQVGVSAARLCLASTRQRAARQFSVVWRHRRRTANIIRPTRTACRWTMWRSSWGDRRLWRDRHWSDDPHGGRQSRQRLRPLPLLTLRRRARQTNPSGAEEQTSNSHGDEPVDQSCTTSVVVARPRWSRDVFRCSAGLSHQSRVRVGPRQLWAVSLRAGVSTLEPPRLERQSTVDDHRPRRSRGARCRPGRVDTDASRQPVDTSAVCRSGDGHTSRLSTTDWRRAAHSRSAMYWPTSTWCLLLHAHHRLRCLRPTVALCQPSSLGHHRSLIQFSVIDISLCNWFPTPVWSI